MATVNESTQERLCRTIASLGAKTTSEDVCQALDPFLESFQHTENSATETRNDRSFTTPLMVACDRAQETCIKWISKNIKENPSLVSLLGSPLDHAESGNTAMHYAANSGCIVALRLLCDMLDGDDTNRPRTLASQRNDNHDTPIMLAAMRGHAEFLRQIVLLLAEKEDAEDVTKLFELVNDGDQSALSLAYGHGHVEAMNVLLQEAGVSVTYDAVKKAEQTLEHIDAALQGTTMLEEHTARRHKVYHCLVILKVALARSAQICTEQLLAEEDAEATKKKASGKAKKKKKARSKQKRRDLAASADATSNHVATSGPRSEVDHDSDDESDTTAAHIVSQTEQMVSTVRDGSDEEPVCVDVFKPKDPTYTPTGPDCRILPQRPTRNGLAADLDVDAVVEALCLEESMLLKNPQDMAENLSPCQLDAIAAVLRNQKQAVEDAQMIQARLRDQADQL